VHPVYEPEHSRDWTTFARRWVQNEGLADGLVVLTGGPSRGNPEANHRLEMTKDANEVEVVYTTNDYIFWRNCK
jgi:hypothetical protein